MTDNGKGPFVYTGLRTLQKIALSSTQIFYIMANKEAFLESIQNGYTFKGEHFKLGCALLDGEVITGADVHLPLKTLNRHGLIAGATGTGKTKTLQIIAEGLSDASVPVLLRDIKGALSGIAAAGANNAKIEERYQKIGGQWTAAAYPT